MWYIYRITNLINGKTYIGQHQYTTFNDGYMGSGTLLRKAIDKYGIDNFQKDILISHIPIKEYADNAEINMIAIERKHGKAEYNIVNGGQGFRGHHREESKIKISNSLIGNHRAKGKNIGNQNAKGNILSEETRKQMGISRQGNINNGCTFIKCVETGKIHRTREWIKLGYTNAYSVAYGKQKTCKGLHFNLV